MDVPFLASSAINREHYHLVQRIESASTLIQIEEVLRQKVEGIKKKFKEKRPTHSECYFALIILLYCLSSSLGDVTKESLRFALPNAVTLAEAGRSLKEKRIGYLFCSELMHETDDLQLMLVNTIRKDLESNKPAQICLALDVVLHACPVDAIPAIRHRLTDLLAHNSPHVKRKVIAVIRTAGRQDFDLLSAIRDKLVALLNDQDANVVSMTLRTVGDLGRARVISLRQSFQILGSKKMHSRFLQDKLLRRRFVEQCDRLLSQVSTDEFQEKVITHCIDLIFAVLLKASASDHALILECFKALSRVPTKIIQDRFVSKSTGEGPLSWIGRLLSSKPNAQYLCLKCLELLDPVLWAGVDPDVPIALSEPQVFTIMSLLESPDRIMRYKTLQVLSRVDRSILLTHMTQLLATPPSHDLDEIALAERAIEAAAVHEQNGRAYSSRLLEVCNRLGAYEHILVKEKGGSGGRLLAQNVVEQVLAHIEKANDTYRAEFIEGLLAVPPSDAGSTFTIIIALVNCEHGHLSSISPDVQIQNLSIRLSVSPPAIQEALLISMLRSTARHSSALPEVSELVRNIQRNSRQKIHKRCEQYLLFSENISLLQHAVAKAKSRTLPDFLVALDLVENLPPGDSSSSQGTRQSSHSMSVSKLRYDAYDAPQPIPKLSVRRNSSRSTRSSSSDRLSISGAASTSSHEQTFSSSDLFMNPEVEDEDLSKTLTAGDLALAAHHPQFKRALSSNSLESNDSLENRGTSSIHQSTTKMDLISLDTLDSPFLAEPSAADKTHAKIDIDAEWDSLKAAPTARGWADVSPEALSQRLTSSSIFHQTLHEMAAMRDVTTFILMSSSSNDTVAGIRLTLGEEGTCFWYLRALDASMKDELKKIMDT